MIVEETLSKCEIKLELTNSEAALQNTKYIWLINQPIVGVESRCLTSCVQLLSMAEAMLNTIFEESSQTRQPSEGLDGANKPNYSECTFKFVFRGYGWVRLDKLTRVAKNVGLLLLV